MGKSTSLIESQHHHLLHCLEKTTVSPSPLVLLFPTPVLPSEGQSSRSKNSGLTSSPWAQAADVRVCLQIQRVAMRSLSTPGRKTPRRGGTVSR